MITVKPEYIEEIEDFSFPFIWANLKIVRRGNVFDITNFDNVFQQEHLFTGNAEACAKFLNEWSKR
jgi:hypothetical protein